ncbi:iron complex transport system permease protein [Actinoalloteichus hoggarensis]|uniref:Putative siderophore transport system permease protein YfiZ n=1 Tax=Actinoalloteichus hoggarensis TaxID=1470176 RepID=A0A221W6H1_9PSEU|nr:iron chelate uptake ABC transporter family permease subunit [Actinoalloteichus hoggarensis]ASO21263.1 putative siderophore transport system permease protein YfiZ precursor [Actinoalloteichus hoggarensis]MBB5921195.1 iron complex transport system permease protein [Actinoalloteichus hoggarensis]
MSATLDAVRRRVPDGRARRRTVGLTLLCVALVLAVAASVSIGSRTIPLDLVWAALVDPRGTEFDDIVRSLRLPRTVLGLLAGAGLGAAGALMQGHTRNPLADPGILGVTQGAAFATVLAVVAFGIRDLENFIWFGFAGALIASVVVFVLGSLGGSTPVTLAMAGAAVTALLGGLVAAVVLGNRAGMEVYRFWQVGSIAAREYSVSGQVAPFLLAGIVLALVNARGLNVLALGEDMARALGQNIRLTRIVGVTAITLLTGAVVAACGPIAFLGLVVPHLARSITGPDYRWIVPVSALTGAVLLLAADVLCRVVSSDSFEVGIMLAVLGAPVFIWLVRRKGLIRL